MGLENRFELFMILKQTLSVLYMKIRQIIVPKSKEAELALDVDEASDSDLFILQLDEDEFYKLWDSNIFHLINKIAPNCIIDDFESEQISDKIAIEEIIYRLKLKANYDYNSIKDLAERIIVLFQNALDMQTSILLANNE